MYTGRMTHDELERFLYITGDPRHAVLVATEENLGVDDREDLEIQVAELERERDEAIDDEQGAADARDKMEDERNEAIEERDRLRTENNAHVAELLQLREAFRMVS